MTVVYRTLSRIIGANGGEAFIGATWDDTMDDGEGNLGDPTATMLVSSVRYQNLTETVRKANVGGTIYEIPVGTPDTTQNIPKSHQVRIDSITYYSFS